MLDCFIKMCGAKLVKFVVQCTMWMNFLLTSHCCMKCNAVFTYTVAVLYTCSICLIDLYALNLFDFVHCLFLVCDTGKKY